MKTLGVIGGIGPESTIDYYRLLIAGYREQAKDDSYPPIIINSIDVNKMLALISAHKFADVTAYLAFEVEKLAKAGAHVALLAANTPHIVFDDIRRLSAIPLISIVEAACEAAHALKLNKLGLFGTRFVMQGEFYSRVFSHAGIRLIAPNPDEQAYVHDKYMAEFLKGVFLPETRKRLLEIVDRLIEREDIQGVVLAGTELPLILRDVTDRPIPFLDTTKIHVKAALRELIP